MDIHNIKTCKECGSSNITYVEEEEQVVCKDCGCVYEQTSKKKE